MSRGFVKEEDQEEVPMVPPRAYLPDGVTNYVTQEGMDLLLAERQSLMGEKDGLDALNENERRISLNYVNAKLQLLEQRISSAKIIDIKEQPQDEVRFGATITLQKEDTGQIEKYQIVGVDETDISKGKISFISPMAKVLINKKVGDRAILKLVDKERVFEILEIAY
ncbi:GreA/GreB family elongation factor [Flagellimonas sp.]|uniref:GreA/GreB family elongation factor n=1 Tax=Flagellimonas sp. TaxID=2058762 RepID=UPI003BA98714